MAGAGVVNQAPGTAGVFNVENSSCWTCRGVDFDLTGVLSTSFSSSDGGPGKSGNPPFGGDGVAYSALDAAKELDADLRGGVDSVEISKVGNSCLVGERKGDSG